MKITRIENQKKRPGRKSIFADGVFLIGVASDTLLRSGLRTGDEITEATLRSLEGAEELLAARTAALRSLAVRARTEREIRDTLRAKQFSDAVAARTIASLKEARLLDDAAFARSFIRNALALKPTGRALLLRKLLLLGVDRGLADEALGEILEGVSQEEEAGRAALAFVSKKPAARRGDPKIRGQLTAYLLRRGYTWDIVRQAVKRALQGEQSEGEDL
ncbi:MAG TPA: RecX family transcriptional regulator [Bacteroidota bacterium]|nr:RecX family transcriptional regulator [Bacteroidota bacterium]